MDKIDCDQVIVCNSDLSSSHCCGSMLIMTGLDEKREECKRPTLGSERGEACIMIMAVGWQ